jgi:hypothetical protein
VISPAPVVFTYKMLRWGCIWFAVANVLLICFTFVVAMRNSWAYAFQGLAILAPIVWFLGVIVIITASDVVVDDEGIARCLFGFTWKRIRWDNTRLITEFLVRGPAVSTRGVNVFPIVKSRFRILPSGKISFTEEMERASELVQMMRQYASRHGIETKFE